MSETSGSASSSSSGPKAKQLVEHVVNQVLALVEAEGRRFGFTLENADDDVTQLRLRLVTLCSCQAFEVESIEQLLMDSARGCPSSC